MKNLLIDVESWWIFLSIFATLNIALWIMSFVLFTKKKSVIHPDIFVWRRLILCLAGVYVAGCAFRSYFPRIDLERVCLVDSWLSNMFVGRSVATIAEICFIAQCAILLREGGKGLGDRIAILVSFMLIPIVIVAEGFSWYAMLTTHYLGSVIEESLWAVCGVLLVASFISLWPKVSHHHRWFLNAMILFGIGFVVFMVLVDVPMYWARWQADSQMGINYLTIRQGILDAVQQCKVSFDAHVWREEIPWMTLYFTVAVWVSISLTHAPNYKAVKKSD